MAVKKNKTVLDAIAEVNLAVASITPDAVNAEYGSKYVTLGKINKELKPLMKKAGIMARHIQQEDDGVECLVTRIILLGADEEDWMEEETTTLIHDGSMQSMVAACTYAKRLNLSNIFDFAVDHDDDGNSISGKESEEGETTSTRKRKAQTVKTSKGRTRAAGTSVSPGLKPAQLEKHGAEIAEMDPEQASDYIMRLMENFELSTDDIDFLNSKVVHDGSTE